MTTSPTPCPQQATVEALRTHLAPVPLPIIDGHIVLVRTRFDLEARKVK